MGLVLRLTLVNVYMDLVGQRAVFRAQKESGEHAVIKTVLVKTTQHVIHSAGCVSVPKVM